VLEARNVSKSYGVVRALIDVDFSVGESEIVALAGENGSGKSTLSRILAGVVQPDAGEIVLDGKRRTFSRPRDALDDGIALVTQEPTACPFLSVAENLLLTRLPGPVSPFRRRRYNDLARPLLEQIEVRVDPGMPFASLRSGDRELVEIGKALAASPRYLILDESTSRLGEDDVQRLFRLLRRLRDGGVSVILITHRLPEIVDLADRAVVLRDGARVGELAREGLTEERLISMMVGRELSDYYHKRALEPGAPVLEVHDLVAEGAQAPVSFQVRAGEIVGLAGLVGSGRTELLETICGARRSGGGGVLVDGRPVPPGSPRTALESGIALVPEERHRQGLNLGARIRENIAMGTWPLHWAQPRRERRLSLRAITQFSIRASGIEAPIRSLSGGNQQKVVIARCLNREPRVLLLDEPTRGIDVGAKSEVFQLMGEMLEQGKAIVIVSSDMLEILGLADRVLVMHERRITGELTRAEATEERIAHLSTGGTETQHAA
jgi:rhamnose transport system ATP-binding protein